MHLLVLSAFRPIIVGPDGIVVWGSQCTFWCSVLSDNENPKSCPRHDWVSMHLLVLSAFRPIKQDTDAYNKSGSQCTFWCSVLSDTEAKDSPLSTIERLNAPFGAQCFPTRGPPSPWPR